VFILLGFDPRRLLSTLLYSSRYVREFFLIRRTLLASGLSERTVVVSPRLSEYKSQSAKPTRHYFVQDNFVADLVAVKSPKSVLDIGSRTDGYVSQLRHITTVTVADIREPNYTLKNVTHVTCDITDPESVADLFSRHDFALITCLHTIEHIGLGRYGDQISIHGDETALKNIFLNMQDNSEFILSVPYSNFPRIEFNAQRVYDLGWIKTVLPSEARLVHCWLFDDDDKMIPPNTDHEPVEFGFMILLLRKEVK